MKTIPLTHGKVALVDDDLYPYLAMNTWCLDDNGSRQYAITTFKRKPIRMHECLMDGGYVDHRDGNGLNNQLSNLRVANKKLNAANSKKPNTNTSGFKGVSRYCGRGNKPWRAHIKVDQKFISLGLFLTKEEAAKAYDTAATLHFGEFARTNKMLGLIS